MNRYIVLALAAALLVILGAVGFLIMSPSSTPAPGNSTPSSSTSASNGSGTVTTNADGSTSFRSKPATEGEQATPKDENFIPRPPNASEIAAEARRARPFNQHVYNVSSWWGRATQLTMTSDPALAAEIGVLGKEMREGTKLENDQLNVTALLDKEDALAQKLKASSSNPEIQAIVQYITESVAVTRAGGDPTTVVRPEIPQ
jgi:hypothetical protein